MSWLQHSIPGQSSPVSTKDPIPQFEVFDASSISIKETHSELERSMAHNGFTSTAIQGSVSGGGFGFAMAASGGSNNEEQHNNNKGEFENRKEYTATYSFPRARVFVEECNLQITPGCKRLLAALRAAASQIKLNLDENANPDKDNAPIRVGKFCCKFPDLENHREEVYFIPDLVAKIPNTKTSAEKDEQVEYSWSDVPEVFELINRQQFNKVPAIPPGTWRGKIRLETDDGRRLIVKDNKLLMTTDAHPDNEVIFTVLDADMKRKKEAEPRLDKVQADHPLFLVTGRTYGREPQESGAQIPGLWADATGVMRTESDAQRKICRWSFRPKDSKVDFEHRWTPDQTVIRDGDEVKIYCHSYHSGAFRSVDEPTYYAPPAMTKTGEPNLRVLEFDQSTWKKFRLQFSIDKSELGFMRTDGQETQSHMDDFDRGMENELQRAELATYRKFFGAIEI
ncbi:MAG: hypothetical protein M1833_005886 [Piccolia ochrophora]|nr:MAG: hypothetical protein M1833_005886 [Piccolia ochrophora]